MKNDKTTKAINDILDLFKNGNLPEALAIASNPRLDVPCSQYSYRNRVLLAIQSSVDSRGYKMWTEVGRNVKRGGTGIRIFSPKTKTFKDIDDEGNEVKRTIITGWSPIVVFDVSQTEGEPVHYDELPVPDLPLLDVAEYLGISVRSEYQRPDCLGYYSPSTDSITLCSPSEKIWYHELSHAIHKRTISDNIKTKVKGAQDPLKEITAELSACTLAYMLGKELPDSLGTHYSYIEKYATQQKLDVFKACMQVFGEVEAVINEIFRITELLNQ